MENDIEQPLLQDLDEVENALDTYISSNGYTQYHPHTFWQQLSFSWLSRLLKLGFTLPQLQQHHLPPLPPQAASDVCGDALWKAWEREIDAARISGDGDPSLIRALFHSFVWNFLALGGLKFINDALNFAGPVLLNGLLRYLDASSTANAVASETAVLLPFMPATSTAPIASSPTTTKPHLGVFPIITRYYPTLDPASDTFGAVFAALLALTFFFKAFLNAQFSYRQGVLSSQVRAALTSLCFRQSLSLSTCQVSTVGTGRIQTLMSVDADKVLGLFIGFHELWSLPTQIGLALYLLSTQVHFAFIAGLILVVLIIPLNKLLANGIQRASVTMMAAKDQRIAIIAELLKGMKIIKASSWEEAFAARVDVARKKELHSLAVKKYLDALCVYLWAATSLLFSLGTFGLFVLVGERLTAQIVFTSLALFSVLLGPINSFPWVING
jgi:ATP-binding cassette subfamily C (CFTR/MRP) protein 10